MYLENCATVFPIKKHAIVVSRSEIGMPGPATRAMIGNVKTILPAGAMWVMPWNTSSGRPSELRRSSAGAVRLVLATVTGGCPLVDHESADYARSTLAEYHQH